MSYTRTTLCPMCKGTRWIVLSAPGERIEAPCIMCNADGKAPRIMCNADGKAPRTLDECTECGEWLGQCVCEVCACELCFCRNMTVHPTLICEDCCAGEHEAA